MVSATGTQEIRINISSEYRFMAILLDPKGRGNLIAGVRSALEFARRTNLVTAIVPAGEQRQERRIGGAGSSQDRLLLTDEDVEMAKVLGNGGHATGIRRAILFAAADFINTLVINEEISR